MKVLCLDIEQLDRFHSDGGFAILEREQNILVVPTDLLKGQLGPGH